MLGYLSGSLNLHEFASSRFVVLCIFVAIAMWHVNLFVKEKNKAGKSVSRQSERQRKRERERETAVTVGIAKAIAEA